MSGSSIGAAVGFFVGGLFGMPQLGVMVGSYLGAVADPTIIKGPSIGDAQAQSTTAGSPIPKVFGKSPPLGVTLIDGDPVARKVTRTESVGKGSTQKTKTEHFIATRAFLVCEGEVEIARITRNGKLVYSIVPGDEFEADSASFAEQITIYPGTETQGPDPSLEALHGVGNTHYYRGRCYFVVRDDEEVGGAMNRYTVEVSACGEVTTTPAYSLADFQSEFWFKLTEGGSTGPDSMGNLPDLNFAGDYTSGAGGLTFNDLTGEANCFTGSGSLENPNTHLTIQVKVRVNSIEEEPASMRWIAGVMNYWSFRYYHWAIFLGGPNKMTPTVGINNMGGAGQVATAPFELAVGRDYVLGLQRDGAVLNLLVDGAIVDSVACSGAFSGTATLMLGGKDNPAAFGGQMTITNLMGTPRAVSSTEMALASYAQGVIPFGMYEVPDKPGLIADADGNVIGNTLESTSISECAALWKDIVAEIALRASPLLPAVLDIDHMTDEVPGFVLGNASLTASDYVRTLCTWYFVDMPEYDGMIHAVRRGGPVVATFDEEDLLEVEEDDDDVRAPALDAFKRITVMYPDPANKYVPTPQTSPRTSPDVTTTNTVTLECPIPFDAATMAQKADIVQKIAFLQVEGGFKRAFPAEFSRYVPSDPIVFNDRRHIIVKASNDDSMVRFECQYDRVSAYTSMATPGIAPTPVPQSSNLKGPTLFSVMNLPRQSSDESTPGVHIGIAGLLPGWFGASVLMSSDGGISYETVLEAISPSTMGTLTAGISSSSEPLSVHAYGGSLESKSPAQLATGQNRLAVTTAGASEVLQFEDADETAVNYFDLTALIRGEMGTVAAAHYTGDLFVDTRTAYFVPIDIGLVGQTLLFKAVSFGTSPDAVTPVPFVFAPLFTGPAVIEFETLSTGAYATTETGAYFEVVSE